MKIRPETYFIFTGALFGLAFIIITPPFESPDETVHFYRAYQVSEGQPKVQVKKEGVGGFLPSSLGKTVDITTMDQSIKFNPIVKYDIARTRQALAIKERPDKKIFYDFSSTTYYSPISYIPQAIGILIGRLLHLAPILLMYLGRLSNLAVWIFLVALSIKLVPAKKWAFVFIGLLPMALFIASSLSADVITVGMTALVMALILKYKDRGQPLSNNEQLILLVILTALVLSKQLMFVLLPLVLLIPSGLFSLRKGRLRQLLLMLLPMIIYVWWTTMAYKIKIAPGIFHSVPSEQISFIIHHPLSYAGVLWNTYFFTGGDSIVGSFIGTFGWVDTPLSELWVIVGYLGLLFVLTAGAPLKRLLNKKEALLLAAVVVIYWLTITTAMYVFYDPVKYGVVVGLQGRYFLPAAILLIPLLARGRVKISDTSYRTIAMSIPILLLSVSVITIIYRYYVHYSW